MRTVSVVTMGCKVNQYDTAAILNKLPNTKYKRVPFSEKADVYVIDTCTVTHNYKTSLIQPPPNNLSSL